MKKSFLSAALLALFLLSPPAPAPAYELGDNNRVHVGNIATEEIGGKTLYKLDARFDEAINLGFENDLAKNKKLLDFLKKSMDASRQVRLTGVWHRKGGNFELEPESAKYEKVGGAKDCPEKVFRTVNIEGIYEGSECGDFCYSTIRTKNGEVGLLGDGEELLGNKTGFRVAATYDIMQLWLDTGDWGFCEIAPLLKSAKRIR